MEAGIQYAWQCRHLSLSLLGISHRALEFTIGARHHQTTDYWFHLHRHFDLTHDAPQTT
jgi:hypothetical protein